MIWAALHTGEGGCGMVAFLTLSELSPSEGLHAERSWFPNGDKPLVQSIIRCGACQGHLHQAPHWEHLNIPYGMIGRTPKEAFQLTAFIHSALCGNISWLECVRVDGFGVDVVAFSPDGSARDPQSSACAACDRWVKSGHFATQDIEIPAFLDESGNPLR